MIKVRFHLLVHQVKHVLHVDKALLDDAVEGADVVEGGHELHEVGAEQDKVAHGKHSLLRDQIRTVDGQGDQGPVENDHLHHVQEGQGGVGLPLLDLS